jgi:hypothetical protein
MGKSLRDLQDMANHAARKAAWAARDKRIAEMWPLMSVREISMELDITATTAIGAAVRLGLKSRPISARP